LSSNPADSIQQFFLIANNMGHTLVRIVYPPWYLLSRAWDVRNTDCRVSPLIATSSPLTGAMRPLVGLSSVLFPRRLTIEQ
jgi:hypothetical protein